MKKKTKKEEKIKETMKAIEKYSDKEFFIFVMLSLSDFRMPLTTIKSYIDLLEKGEFVGKEKEVYKVMEKTMKEVSKMYENLYGFFIKKYKINNIKK